MADGVLSLTEPNAVQVAQARAHIESVPDDHDTARVRALRRQLERHERRIGAAMIAEARDHLRRGATMEARLALAAVPPQSAAARQVAGLTRQIEQRERREARALAVRGPLTPYEAESAVAEYLLATAHDPSSIDLEGCGGLWWDDNSWMIDCAFRGSNAFGATVLNARRFYIRHRAVIRATAVSRIRE